MSLRRVALAIIVASWPLAWGCASLLGIEDTTDEDGRIGVDASRDLNANDGDAPDRVNVDGDVDGDSDGGSACPGIHGPKMVRVTAGFCIDATEVTRADYAAFVIANPSLPAQGPECAFNTSLNPSGWPYAPDADLAIPAGVNWCDAVAYCKWAGKHLCGSRGDGGAVAIAQGSDPKVSEWMAACSRDGATFPYGNSYAPTRCNGKSFDAGRTIRAGQATNCEGGDPGIFDMSGNAWEWDYSCTLDDAGRPTQCGQRGGSFTDDSALLICALSNYQDIDLKQESSGFRCCAQ